MACCILDSIVCYWHGWLFPVSVSFVLLAVTFACNLAAFCSHHRHKLWVCGDKQSALPTAKPSSSASSTKGCEQPSRVTGQPGSIHLPRLCLLYIILTKCYFPFVQSTRYRWGDLGRVHVQGDWHCRQLGADGWDEGNVLVHTVQHCDAPYVNLSNHFNGGTDHSLVRIPLESLLFRTTAVA